MIQLELEISDKPIEINLKFNDVFQNELKDKLVGIIELSIMTAGNEYNWFDKAQDNVLKEMMSWKDGN